MLRTFWNSNCKSVLQFLLGIIGLALITFAARLLDLQPGAISLLFLIAIVFVALRAGFVTSVSVSLVATICLHYYFIPLLSPAGRRNPLAIVATAAFLITAWTITAMVARVRKLTETQLTLGFEERLAEEARRYKEAAERESPGSMARELLLRRVRQFETAIHLNEWVRSPGLQPPK